MVVTPLGVALAAVLASYLGLRAALGFDVAWTSAAIGALAGTAFAARRANAANRDRWRLWTLAAGCWLVGQLGWDVFGVVGFSRSPNVADAAWWGFALVIMASMVQLERRSRTAPVVSTLETVQLIAAALALCFGEQWSQVATSSLAVAPTLSALAYPAFYVSATVLTVQTILGGALSGLRTPALRLVLAGIGAQAIASSCGAANCWRGPRMRLAAPKCRSAVGANVPNCSL